MTESSEGNRLPATDMDPVERLAKVIDEAIERHIISEGHSDWDGFCYVMNALGMVVAQTIGVNVQPEQVSQVAKRFGDQLKRNTATLSKEARRQRERPTITVIKEENLAPLQVTRAIVHEIAVKHAEQQFTLHGVAPYLWVVAHNRTRLTWIETPWSSRIEKTATVRQIRERMKALGAHCYAHIGEAWVGSETSDKPIDRTKAMPPRLRDAKHRDDIMFVSSEDRDGGFGTTHWLVTVRPGKQNLLGPRMDQDDDVDRGGLMVNLLAEPVQPAT